MWGYDLPGERGIAALDSQEFRRFREAFGVGNYTLSPHAGTTRVRYGTGEAKESEDKTPEGWTYLRPPVTPLPETILRAETARAPGRFVTLSTGVEMFIACGIAGPTRVRFRPDGRVTAAGPATEFGKLCQATLEDMRKADGVFPLDDPRVNQLLLLSFMAGHHATVEIAADMLSEHLTSDDFLPCLSVIWGTDLTFRPPTA